MSGWRERRAADYEAIRARGDHVRSMKRDSVCDLGKLGPACTSKHGGHWHCATCGEGFFTQLEKDSHISEPPKGRGLMVHTLVWVCHVHGPEASS